MVTKKSLKKFFNKIHLPRWLIILLSIVLVLRIPSFFEPFSYGDEMIYLALGEAIRQGIPLYKGIHDNKPPLLYILAAIAGSVFWFKVILAFWNLITIILFAKLVGILFPKEKNLVKISTIIFAVLTTIPLLEGNIANAEIFMIGPTILAFLLLLSKKLRPKLVFGAGVLFSISTLFKVPASFDMPAIVFLWLISSGFKVKKLKEVGKNTLYLILGFLIPIFLTLAWYFSKGAFGEYIVAAFLQNVGYLSTFRPEDVVDPFFVRNGPLFLRAAITLVGLIILYIYRKKLSKQFIFASAWLILSLFAVTLSERPYPHYLIQSVPAISILFGILLTQESLEQSLTIIPLSLAFFVPVYFNFWYYQTFPYYARFIKFTTRQIDRETYLASFGGHIVRNYEIASFITESTKRKDRVFVWGPDSSMVYALSRRLPPIKYVADYHINDFSSKEGVLSGLEADKPELIVILPNSPSFPEIIPFLRENYILVSTIDGAEIWNAISPQVLEKLPLSLF